MYSIWRKMERKQLAFEQVLDVRALRVLVPGVADCYAALGVVHAAWRNLPAEFDDYIATPKPNGYRSIHTAVEGPGGKIVEVQIRTREMHERAELGVAAHWVYKEGGRRDAGFERKVEQLRLLLAPAAGDDDPLGRVGPALFAEHVYVLSPKGDVVELPAGATPLDFAYHVHTNVGHRCRGARVDGRMVPLDHRLVSGTTVEIITGRELQPSRDWLVESLGFLASKSARAKVRAWFRVVDEAEHARAGRAILERELGRRSGAPPLAHEELAAELGFPSAEALCIALGAGDTSAAQLAAALQRRERLAAPATHAADEAAAAGPVAAEGIRVMGVGDLLSHLARCCGPVPPEPITGYVTLGRGVTIHRALCRNVARMGALQPDRLVAVDWGRERGNTYPVEFSVLAFDRPGLVRDVSSLLADARLSIDRMTTATEAADRTARMTCQVKVRDLGELEAVLARIAGLPDVIRVQRR
jgi:GTP pyrophosphokinase